MTYFENIAGATPIEDVSDLIPTHITSRSDLNEWEAANILKAVRKYLSVPSALEITVSWIKQVHKEMFDQTWKWAGEFRRRNFNLGVDWHNIQGQLKLLIDDLSYWEKENTFDFLQQSVRLHHRLVKIHPFVNGNGRHARLVADIFLFSKNHKLPTWPNKHLIEATELRQKYISALKSADKGDYVPLEEFSRKLIESPS